MPRIRVLLAELPGMLGDIIRKLLASEKDIEVVGEMAAEELLEFMGQTRADVVILGLEDSELPAIGNQLFSEHPAVRVLGVAGDGRSTFLYELRPYKVPLGEVSPKALVTAIRSVAGSTALRSPTSEAS